MTDAPSLAPARAGFRLKTSVGRFLFCWNDETRLVEVHWESRAPKGLTTLRTLKGVPGNIKAVLQDLKQYLQDGTPLPDSVWMELEDSAWTDFQRNVYNVIRKIPHGETRSYAWVAERIGKPGAVRAVGGALRRNPLPVVVPCHRVISSQGDLGGFMGKRDPKRPELHFKKALLDLESRYRNPTFSFF